MLSDTRIRLGMVFVCISLLAVPVMAGAYTIIQQGGTVFIGEQGLNVAAALGNDTSVGWWASGAAIPTSSPERSGLNSVTFKFLRILFAIRAVHRNVVPA